MELFIRVKDGKPFGCPLLRDNLQQVFPDFDANNPLPEFARFVSVLPDEPDGVYRTKDTQYEWEGDVVKQVWVDRDMTEEEKAQKIAYNISMKPSGDQWVFDETLCEWVDPAAAGINTLIGVSSV
jgi:hypothetical protein